MTLKTDAENVFVLCIEHVQKQNIMRNVYWRKHVKASPNF